MAANWTEGQKLIASDGAADDDFGISVSISGDTALIGALLMTTTGSSLVRRTCSPAPAPPGLSSKSSSPQTAQHVTCSAVLFFFQVTALIGAE